MTTILEPARQTSVASDTDVLVCGGGPAGFAAAVSAARMGARTLLIEQSGAVGGVATSGLMSHWTGATRGGIYEEIIHKTKRDEVNWHLIDPEALKTGLLDMLQESGAMWLLYTQAVAPIVVDGQVRGVISESKDGRQAHLARVVVDASGDGDMAARAGAPFVKGRETDGKMQPVTTMFKIGGVDTDAAVFPGGFEDDPPVRGVGVQQLGRKYLRHPAGHVLIYRSTLPGVVSINMTNCTDIDGTSAADLTRADLALRRQIDEIHAFLMAHVPGFESSYVLSSAPMVGVRETRHFVGEYALSGEDILSARAFPDWVVERAHFNFDVHSLTGAGLDETGAQKAFPQKRSYQIPYRCLLPQGVQGLLLAGRSISGTHMAHANFRVMPICANIGQGAGIAAALAALSGAPLRSVDISAVQAEIKARESRVPPLA